jgi:hypothetical protein
MVQFHHPGGEKIGGGQLRKGLVQREQAVVGSGAVTPSSVAGWSLLPRLRLLRARARSMMSFAKLAQEKPGSG